MEILSTGEKIKRARVYKGLTLKELCQDKVSVSKMSCIENNKVKPELWIVEFVGEKLDVDINYLKKDVKDHLEENLLELKNKKGTSNDYEEELKYNIDYAEKYDFYNLALKFMNLLFNYYMDKGNTELLQVLQCKYYELYQKDFNDEGHRLYYMDMAKYLLLNKEYVQASNHYKSVTKLLSEKENKKSEDFSYLITALYNELNCYLKLKNYEEAHKAACTLEELMGYVENPFTKAQIYNILALLSLRTDKENFRLFEEKCYEYYGENNFDKAQAMCDFGESFLDLGLKEEGLSYIERGLEYCPKHNKGNLVKYLLSIIEILLKNNFVDRVSVVCEDALNLAIELDSIIFIEKAYYYKAIICEKQKNNFAAEMYMNLSLDSLVKFAGKKDIYKRYLEMGVMYHNLHNTSESLKYFSLAMKMEKSL